MTRRPTVSIVVPFFNEKESLGELVDKLEKATSQTADIVEYIFVDDGSRDGGADVLKQKRSKLKRSLTIVRLRRQIGKSAALSVGFSQAKGEYIVTLDADLQDEPAEIPNLLAALSTYDVVIGWRKSRQDKATKKLSSYIFNTIVSRIYGVHLHDMNSGLKAFTREVASEVRLYGELHRYFPVLAKARGFRVGEVPVAHHKRAYGASKFNGSRVVHAFFDLASTLFLTSFEHEPLQMFGKTGVGSIAIGLFILVYLSVLHFMGESIIGRPLLLLGMLLVLFGMQMVSTGLVGELIVHTRRHEPQSYPIAEVIE